MPEDGRVQLRDQLLHQNWRSERKMASSCVKHGTAPRHISTESQASYSKQGVFSKRLLSCTADFGGSTTTHASAHFVDDHTTRVCAGSIGIVKATTSKMFGAAGYDGIPAAVGASSP